MVGRGGIDEPWEKSPQITIASGNHDEKRLGFGVFYFMTKSFWNLQTGSVVWSLTLCVWPQLSWMSGDPAPNLAGHQLGLQQQVGGM